MISVLAWLPCDCCDEYWCVIHKKHAFECECPEIEAWEENGYWPYGLKAVRSLEPEERKKFRQFLKANRDVLNFELK